MYIASTTIQGRPTVHFRGGLNFKKLEAGSVANVWVEGWLDSEMTDEVSSKCSTISFEVK